MKNTFAVMIVLLLFVFPLLPVASATEVDGEMWRHKSVGNLVKYAIVNGLGEGLWLGLETSAGSFGEEQSPAKKIFKANYDRFDGYMKKASVKQISDGIDTFYADYRNRGIRLRYVMWIVLRGISGDSQAELDELTEDLRKFSK